ncbi:MAG: hypothetical protein NC184_07645 [Roseburia sp.]|nr:hypothetical protein [Roseburia sp.]
MSENEKNTGGKIGSIDKFKRFIRSPRGRVIALTTLTLLALLFTVLLYSIPFSEYTVRGVSRSGKSFWTANLIYINSEALPGLNDVAHLNAIFIPLFAVCVCIFAAAFIVLRLKNSTVVFIAAAIFNAVVDVATIILGVILAIVRSGAVVCGILGAVSCVLLLTYVLLEQKARNTSVPNDASAKPDGQAAPISAAAAKKYRLGILVCECVSLAILVLSFVLPLYSSSSVPASTTIPIRALSANAPIDVCVIMVLMLLGLLGAILSFIFGISSYTLTNNAFVKQSRKFMTIAGVFVVSVFLAGFGIAFICSITSKMGIRYTTISYISLLVYIATLVVYAVFYGKLSVGASAAATRDKPVKFEPLIYIVLMTVATVASLFLKIVDMQVSAGDQSLHFISISGIKLLGSYPELNGGFQILAFLEIAVLLITGIFLALALVAYFAKDRGYYKIVKAGVVTNFLFGLLLGLFGLYFKVAVRVNEESILSLLALYNITVPETLLYSYKVSSQTIYMLIAQFAIVIVMLIRGVFSMAPPMRAEIELSPTVAENATSANSANGEPSPAPHAPDFDACPAFTDIDSQQARFDAELEQRRKLLFESPTLPSLVRFVVDYARECRLHLSYTAEDIATFVAGLGASRLTILQGMSGTGKTSLPKIFAEAVMGNCEIVEVESSWRDKNELLGYYNEFSKCYTPKKFTQYLYKAHFNPSVITFIVLDEMNLSRIEYYFSDFLSLMEHEEDRREIKLSNVKLFRRENAQTVPYAGLTDGHTVKIPSNIWFIGTANRDESTFAISDKVYDRAQTMNFNKRAPKIYTFGEPLEKRFVPYATLLQLFDTAKSTLKFDAESNAAILETERLLAPYNISFGNRVLKQIEDFVKIYCACFGDKAAAQKDAVERILLSKVVSKLETKIVENKNELAAEFDKIGLKNCGAFVRSLSED